ncbi:helix-turn-helix domain-containing protein [bacterium]|nr:helix-turn-helix domain-containing protein [bacterium]
MTIKLENPNDFPVEFFESFLRASASDQEVLRLYLECSDEVQSVVRSMYAVLANKDVSEDDRYRAITTIANALYPISTEGHGNFGMDLAQVERDTATKHPKEHLRPLIAKRLEELDSQEATFAERLRSILEQKNIKQEELADRISCTQSAISKMLTRNSRPRKETIFKMADALDVSPMDLWPDLEVAAILDSIADFHQDRDLTPAQAAALDAAAARPPVKIKARDLPSRKRK